MMGQSYSSLAYSFLLLFLFAGLSVAREVNFGACFANNVTKLDNNDTSDPLQCFKWDPTHTNRTHTSQIFLSLYGCNTLCGNGFQYYSAADIAFRLTLFIVPLISLAGRVGIAPGSIANMFWTIVHLLGDPIDSIWSTLTRQEKARRNYYIGLEIAPGAAHEVAAIWTAYDQWWQDPVEHFEKGIKKRGVPVSRDRFLNEPYQPNRSETFATPAPENQPGNRQSRNIVPDFFTFEEIYYMKKAARNLANNRTNHPITSWFAIIIFVGALTAGYVHLATSRTTNEVSHALAVMTLFFFLPFAVYITGHVGNFKHPEEVIDIVFKIHEKYPDLFPAPKLVPDDEGDGKQSTSERTLSRQEFYQKYDDIQSFAGLNNSWRPRKHLASRNFSDRGQLLLLFQSFSSVIISWLGAFLLSYMTPVWGLGCRSGSWTIITIAWLLSALLDFASQGISVDLHGKEEVGKDGEKKGKRLTKKTAQILWWFAMVKDFIFTLCILILVGLAQVGYFNTCWCMASMFFRPQSKMDKVCIDLGPLQQKDRDADWIRWLLIPIVTLILIHTIIFWAGWEGEGGRLLYLRTKPERDAEKIALENMHARLMFPDNDSDVEEQHHLTQQNNVTATSGWQGPEPSAHQFLSRRRNYTSSSMEWHQLETIVEPSATHPPPRPAPTPPQPSLSPGRGNDSGGSSEAITPLSDSHSQDPLLAESRRLEELYNPI